MYDLSILVLKFIYISKRGSTPYLLIPNTGVKFNVLQLTLCLAADQVLATRVCSPDRHKPVVNQRHTKIATILSPFGSYVTPTMRILEKHGRQIYIERTL